MAKRKKGERLSQGVSSLKVLLWFLNQTKPVAKSEKFKNEYQIKFKSASVKGIGGERPSIGVKEYVQEELGISEQGCYKILQKLGPRRLVKKGGEYIGYGLLNHKKPDYFLPHGWNKSKWDYYVKIREHFLKELSYVDEKSGKTYNNLFKELLLDEKSNKLFSKIKDNDRRREFIKAEIEAKRKEYKFDAYPALAYMFNDMSWGRHINFDIELNYWKKIDGLKGKPWNINKKKHNDFLRLLKDLIGEYNRGKQPESEETLKEKYGLAFSD